MAGKIHQTREEKYAQSLDARGDDENRPFIRVKINIEKDREIYLKKQLSIEDEKKAIAAITGDSIENINLIDPWGQVYSNQRNIKDFNFFEGNAL